MIDELKALVEEHGLLERPETAIQNLDQLARRTRSRLERLLGQVLRSNAASPSSSTSSTPAGRRRTRSSKR